MCTKEYTPLDGFARAAKQVDCILQCTAYTNTTEAFGQCCLMQGYPPSRTMKALLSKAISLTDLAHGRLPLRFIPEAFGLRDLKFKTQALQHPP